ncbi:unnamed protein product [Caenorhabditis angaria]|uniref:Protein arginine N-methyltransferase n=1 Tax=Caenorhabditis angaria TaxID=860376 RepID=A0A9P1ILK6_9PELO|nr:unnamed protein product [Caenorhabditis angaria]
MSKTYSDLIFDTESTRNIDEANSRINIGWITSRFDVAEHLDRKVVEFSSKLGAEQYNFIVYPVGGIIRGFWDPRRFPEAPPNIDLPDLQLANHLWETYVCAGISEWIDCDSENPDFAKFSEQELIKELNYACYLGLRTVVLNLTRKSSPNLAKIIKKWLWTKNVLFTIWVSLPTNLPKNEDLWSVWADFRKDCANFNGVRLQAILNITADLQDEFLELKLVERWKAEPVGAICVHSDVFTTGKDGQAVLPQLYQKLLQNLWMFDSMRLLLKQINDGTKYRQNLRREYATSLRFTVRNVTWMRQKMAKETDGFLATSNLDYHDVLQAPLQPLSDNLDSGVYNTFEQDPVKYQRYRDAVQLAFMDIAKDKESVVVYLLGAGRGPIGTMILEAEKRYNSECRDKNNKLKIKFYVVEKNPNAIVTLRFMNENAWRKRAILVESDMRSLPSLAKENNYEQPDLIVSELLGSFGDNELSPECLDGVTDFLKPTTISIPQKYTSYAAPIMSLNMHQTIKSAIPSFWGKGLVGHGRNEPELEEDDENEGEYVQKYPQGMAISRLDQIYVVYLRQFCALAENKPVFTFEHPNFAKTSNDREIVLDFDIDRAADIMGFAGYFDMILYKNVMLSIEPKTFSNGMISWFPAVIPLRKLYRVAEGDRIKFVISRKSDADGVWYEWNLEIHRKNGEIFKSPLQNQNGESYYMRK